jgi:hypothetical protein
MQSTLVKSSIQPAPFPKIRRKQAVEVSEKRQNGAGRHPTKKELERKELARKELARKELEEESVTQEAPEQEEDDSLHDPSEYKARFAPFAKKMHHLPLQTTRSFRYYYEKLLAGEDGYLASQQAQPVDNLPTVEDNNRYWKLRHLNGIARAKVVDSGEKWADLFRDRHTPSLGPATQIQSRLAIALDEQLLHGQTDPTCAQQ